MARRKHRRRHTFTAHHNPIRRHRRHRRTYRNPIGGHGSVAHPMGMLKPALVGAVGGLAVNGLVNYLPIPDALKAGKTLYLTRAGLAIALGMFGKKIPGIGKYSNALAAGALIITAADLGKEIALESGYNLSGMGYVSPARVVSRVPRQLPRPGVAGMGKYVVTPARQLSRYVR